MLTYTFPHEPMPAVRVTGKALWLPRAQAYGAYKAELARCLKEAYPELIVPPRPPQVTKRVDAVGWQARKDWNKAHAHKRYRLACFFSKPPKTSDLDNLAKSVMDALQLAGIVPNDNMVDVLELAKGHAFEPSTCIILTELDPPSFTDRLIGAIHRLIRRFKKIKGGQVEN